jgi:predicted ATP-grasp superfamily ATP-dependent carboligase
MTRRVLLLGADDYGTLAAARTFGQAGFEVTVADERRHAQALYSRHVKTKLVHPSVWSPSALIDWLADWGTRHPGALLYPTNDHLAWLFDLEGDRLSAVFVMLASAVGAVFTLLDKKRLLEACSSVGIDVPATLILDEVVGGVDSDVVRSLKFPVLLKPRTQVYLRGGGIKGLIARDYIELGGQLKRFRKLVSYAPFLADRHPDIAGPLLQEYLTAAETDIYSVSGFADESGVVVARAAVKMLQRPRKLGIGLCYEGRPVEQPVVNKLSSLCRAVGYRGAFEAEFIPDGERRLLIDFNPRFYSQMGFDIARGVVLPRLVWHAANDDHVSLKAELDKARAWTSGGNEVYCHKTWLDLLSRLQGLSRQMNREQRSNWRSWYANHKASATDAVRDTDDPMPAVVDAAQWGIRLARYPRSSVRDFVINR